MTSDETKARNGEAKPLNGAAGAHDEADGTEAETPDEGEEQPLEPPPVAVAELAAACVRFVTTRYGVMLDFTPETLSLLDAYVRDARHELSSRPETVDLVQGSLGAYLGEVLRRAFGGDWFAEGDPIAWRVYFSRVYLAFNPIGMIREALLLAPQDGWHAHLEMDPGEREAVERRLEALPEVEEEEFYSPTTRFDIVSIAYDALRAQMLAAGVADVRFSRDDYR